MKGAFNTFIDHIDIDFWRELCLSAGMLRHYARGEDFAKIGEVARYVGFIKSGAMKYVVYSTDGTEHVIGLEFAGEFVSDFPFSLSEVVSRASIIAVTQCDVYCVEVKDIAKRMNDDSGVKDIVMCSTEAVFSTVYDRYIALYSKTPQERYNELISQHPDIFNFFPLKDIASFLNITPTHLSRQRKNVFK